MSKSFELSIEERDNLCRVLTHVMEQVCNAHMYLDLHSPEYKWDTPEAEQEYAEMKALKERLLPKRVQKSGWVHTNLMFKERPENIAEYKHVTWEEVE
jgi:hypothetical protein